MEFIAVADGTLVWPTKVRPWFSDEPKAKDLNISFLHGKDKKSLTVTVDGVWEDDLYTDELVPFLLQQGVIDGEWVITKTEDTDGHTELEDTYTTFYLKCR